MREIKKNSLPKNLTLIDSLIDSFIDQKDTIGNFHLGKMMKPSNFEIIFQEMNKA